MLKSRSYVALRRAMSALCSAGFLLAFSFFASCQTASSPETSRTGEKSIVFELADQALVPDHAFATFADGTEKPVKIGQLSGAKMSFTVNLEKALGADEQMSLNLSSHGLVTTTVACVVNSNGDLEQVGAIVRDTMARTIVRRLDGATYPKTQDGAIQAYADALLERQPLFQPFPGEFPKGLDTAKVRVEALRRAAKLSKPLEQLVGEWGLPLSYPNARTQILALVPPIPSSDSAILFPPPHVRVQQELASLGDLGAGGDAVGIVGSIASDIALASVDIDVLDANGVVASDKFSIRCSQPKGTVLWDLAKDGQVSIKAVSALPGTYTIQIVGRDIQGRSTYLTLEITVKVTGGVDDQGPAIRMISPASDTTVEHTVATFDVVVSATDLSGVDSVAIGGGAASKNSDGNWQRSVALDTTGAATAVEIAAFDHVGNSSRESVRITRRTPPGVVVPVIRIVEPASLKDLVLPFEASTLLVKWTISDKSGIAEGGQTITGGTPALVSDSTWQAVVGVPATGKPFSIVIAVRNKDGKSASESFMVTRARDSIPPRIVPRAGSRSVSTDSSSAIASWTVTDNHKLDSVLVQGTLATPDANGVYSTMVPMVDSVNKVVLVAMDSSKSRSYDTIVLRRGADKAPPEITAIAPTPGQTVDHATKTFLVRIKAIDPSGIDTVLIQGGKADFAQGEYQREIPLTAIGSPTSIAIHVVDKQGNPADIVLQVTRSSPPDDSKPSLSLVSPGAKSGVVLPVDSGDVVVRWKVVDIFGVAANAVLINGQVANKEADSVWSMRVALAPTGVIASIPVSVTNVKGTLVVDSVLISRLKDTVRPKIQRLAGNVSSVAFSTGAVDIGWSVTDNHKLASVAINGLPATSIKDGDYLSSITLSVGENKVLLLAKDSLGNERRDTVVVTREKDLVAPVAVLMSGLQKRMSVDFAKGSLVVGWTIKDNDKMGSVTIGGVDATRSGDDYSVSVDLPVGETKVALLAKDAQGNEARDTVFVTRAKDLVAPAAVLLTGLQKAITVDYSVTSKKIGWTITDNHKLGTVLINKVAVAGSNGEYSTTLSDLPMGETKVFLEASDSTGNVTLDTVVVTRVLGASPVLTFSHLEGTHDSVLHVSISSSVPDAVVKYTVDGSNPSPTNGLTYSLGGTILVSQSRTIKVMATATGRNPSAILSRIYTLKADPPTFSVVSGTTADSMFTVKLSSPTAGATFYYTTDGSTPIAGVSASTTSGILVDSIRTLKVIAGKTGWSSSDAITGKFNANIPVMVYVGQGGTKVVRADGSLWTTGAAAGLVDGSVNDRTTFEKVLEGVRSVDNGLILTTTGDVLSYGGRYGSSATSMNPIASGIVKISAGAEPSAMLLDSKGGLYAMGQNGNGQLCTGDLVDVPAPKLVASGVKDVGAACTSARGSPYCRSIYVTNAGSAYGCGRDIGVTQTEASLPTQIPGSGYISTAAWADFFQGGYPQQNTLLKSTGELMQLISTSSGRVWTSVRTGVVKAYVAGNSLYSLENYGWLHFLGAGGSPATDWTEVSNHITDMATDGATNLYIKMDGTLWASGYNGGRYGDGTTEDAAAMKRIRLPN